MYGFIFGIFILFHWYMCLFLCQYRNPYDNCFFAVYSKVKGCELLILFFLKIVFTIWVLSYFHTNFKIIGNCSWYFVRDCIDHPYLVYIFLHCLLFRSPVLTSLSSFSSLSVSVSLSILFNTKCGYFKITTFL